MEDKISFHHLTSKNIKKLSASLKGGFAKGGLCRYDFMKAFVGRARVGHSPGQGEPSKFDREKT